MNNVAIIGRLVADPEVRYGQNQSAVARYRLAVEKRFKRQDEPDADFIPVVAFGKAAEFAEKYFAKGKKIAVTGRIQTGSYTNKDGQRIYTWDVVAENQEFVESKAAETGEPTAPPAPHNPAPDTAWMDVPEGLDELLPFR